MDMPWWLIAILGALLMLAVFGFVQVSAEKELRLKLADQVRQLPSLRRRGGLL